MRKLDAAAIEQYSIAGIILMENAGRQTVSCMERHFGCLAGKRITIFAGPGNNGGDGLVVARLLHHLGAHPVVLLLAASESFRDDAAINLAAVQKLELPLVDICSATELHHVDDVLSDSDFVVDALFGTGLCRPVEGVFAEVVERINLAGSPVVAVDIPSGVCSDTGQSLGKAVRADLTVTFCLAKPGQVVYPGRGHVGILEVVDIGIPAESVAEAGLGLELLEKQQVRAMLPERKSDGHKGTFGHLLIVGGSVGRTGAAILAARGALRSGVGLVSLCVPHDLNAIFEAALIEAMTIPLQKSVGHISDADRDFMAAALSGKKALVVGPGIGTAPETADAVRELCSIAKVPVVVDADGLTILADNISQLRTFNSTMVFTPHPGEMARLAAISTADVQKDRIGCARRFAEKHGITVVLKGAGSVIAAPDGRVAISPTGNAGMATGGMGDVLSGLIGGLLAQGVSPWHAACLGVYVHGLAGDRLAASYGIAMGLAAGELADELPVAFGTLLADHTCCE